MLCSLCCVCREMFLRVEQRKREVNETRLRRPERARSGLQSILCSDETETESSSAQGWSAENEHRKKKAKIVESRSIEHGNIGDRNMLISISTRRLGAQATWRVLCTRKQGRRVILMLFLFFLHMDGIWMLWRVCVCATIIMPSHNSRFPFFRY